MKFPTVACNDPMEPNDRSYEGTVLPLGTTTNGLICTAVDADWFVVTVPADGPLNLGLTISGGQDYDLELYGPDFNWVTASYNQAGQNETIRRTVVAGDYYVRVYGYQGANSPSQPYQLSVNTSEVQPPGPTSGPITNAVVWSGVVEPTGDVTIMSGGSLKIMPGTQVRCAGGDDRASGVDSSRVEIILNGGTLDASGAPDALIRFTSRAQNPVPGNWYGLRIVEGSLTLTHCVIEYATEGIRFEDNDTRFNSYTLEDSTVQRCSGSGVWTTSGQFAVVTLNNFLLTTNGTGLSANGPVTLVDGQVLGKNGSGVNAGALLTATGTTISQNGGVGISGGPVALNGCVITRNRNTGVGSTWGALTACQITFNQGDGVGISCQGSLQMAGCTLANNSKRLSNPMGGMTGPGNRPVWESYDVRLVFQATGLSSATLAAGHSAIFGRTSSRYSRGLIFSLRQVSKIEAIAATRGPACSLPICNQFFRPTANGLI